MKRSDHVRIWEFEVAPERREQFEDCYGAAGDWAGLFREAEGWISTRLYCAAEGTGLYRTVDSWKRKADWTRFRARHADAYQTLDSACSALTRAERELYAGEDPAQVRRLLKEWVEVLPAGIDEGPLALDGELDLHRFPPNELKDLVRSAIEQCREEGVLELRIVHGKGIGTQRELVHAVLREMPEAVEEFGLAPGDRGGWGATLVKLKAV